MTATPPFPALAAAASDLDVRSSAGSTNAVLAERAAAGEAADGAVVVTLDQRAGRGRRGRAWTAPPGAMAATSVLLRLPPGVDVASSGWLSLAAGAAMAAAVDAVVGGGRTSAKWPNDVLVDGGKVCGILSERVAAAGDGHLVVVGAGLNTTMTRAERPVETATSLALAGVAVDDGLVDRVLADYVARLRRLVADFAAAGGDAEGSGLLGEVLARCGTIGRGVRIVADPPVAGTATGIDALGRLVVDTAGGAVAVAAGDVEHVRGDGGPVRRPDAGPVRW